MRKQPNIKSKEIELFDNNIQEIDRLISCHISKWKMKAIPSIDKDDVAQMIRFHIIKKLHLYDPARPLGNWLTTVICNFLKNLTRNFFYKTAPPCISLKCAAHLGGSDCKIYIKTCSDCPLYAKWEKEKKQQHDISLPLSLENENRMQKLSDQQFEDTNILDKIEELKFKLKDKLTNNEFYIFNALYLENKTDNQILSELKFSSKTEGIRQIKNLRNIIFNLVKQTIVEEDLF